jgi:hypothetical protein
MKKLCKKVGGVEDFLESFVYYPSGGTGGICEFPQITVSDFCGDFLGICIVFWRMKIQIILP